MKPRDYFEAWPLGVPNADRVRALRAELLSWRGTPFRERSAVKGEAGGVHCAGLIGTSFFNIGAVPACVAVPPYDVNHAEHSEESVLRAWLEQPEARAFVRPVDEDEPHLDGDMVFPKVGRTEHHLGTRIGDRVYHVVRPCGFSVMTITQLKFHRSRYRLIESTPSLPCVISCPCSVS